MYNKLIIFFLRKKFGLKRGETFRFNNQRSKVNVYYFTENVLIKIDAEKREIRESNVKLNWLLDEKCKITKSEIPTELCKALVFANCISKFNKKEV